MSERWARAALLAYRLAGAAVFPLVGTYVAWRASKGKEDRLRRRERYGQPSRPRPPGPVVWVHAVSVGETIAVTPLIERIHDFGIQIVLTTGTVTSAKISGERLGGRVIHQYVPLDLKPAVSRFLDHWSPDLAIIAESELWPMTILELGARRVPQVIVNGRLSDRSFASWQRHPDLAEALFENLAHVVAQSQEDGARFQALGARPVTVSGNLKGDAPPPAADMETLSRLRAQIGARKVWAAISTHEGEEKIVADVHRLLRGRHGDVLTVLVPRHPERGDAIAELCAAAGLSVARRSLGDTIAPDTDVFLGDTVGEMGLYLRLTEIAFVGRSLVDDGGGQNPLEPAMLETAVLSGKHIDNFREAYHKLISSGAAKLVRDTQMLAGAVDFLLNNEAVRRRMMAAGGEVVEGMRGALAETLATLEPYINPLIVKARLGERETDTR